ncbi:MAG: GlxA family transcriptional regulator [Parvibaculaceae bacterium]
MDATPGAIPVFDALVIVAPNTNMLTVTALIDGMRAANHMGNTDLFRCRIVTADGLPVAASNGFTIPARQSLAGTPLADHIFMIASYAPEPATARLLTRYLKRAARHAPVVYGIDHGSIILAEAGLLDGHRATTHWEVLPSLAERHPEVEFVEELFVFDRNRVTCAGHTASVDLVIHLIARHCGAALAAAVMREMIHGRLRNGAEHQKSPETDPASAADHPLGRAIALMAEKLDAPLAIGRIARLAYVSRRQLESLFARHVNASPARYYMGLRLARARELLLYSSLRIVEISSAAGFASQANFARAFRREFGTTPNAYRRNFRLNLDRPVAPPRS